MHAVNLVSCSCMYISSLIILARLFMATKSPTIEELAHKANISKGFLDRECSSQDLRHVAKYCMKWKQIGHQLGLDSRLSDIDSDHTHEEDKKIAMLTTWKEAFSFKATFRVLIEALIACGCVQSAYQIMEYFANKGNHVLHKQHSCSINDL